MKTKNWRLWRRTVFSWDTCWWPTRHHYLSKPRGGGGGGLGGVAYKDRARPPPRGFNFKYTDNGVRVLTLEYNNGVSALTVEYTDKCVSSLTLEYTDNSDWAVALALPLQQQWGRLWLRYWCLCLRHWGYKALGCVCVCVCVCVVVTRHWGVCVCVCDKG